MIRSFVALCLIQADSLVGRRRETEEPYPKVRSYAQSETQKIKGYAEETTDPMKRSGCNAGLGDFDQKQQEYSLTEQKRELPDQAMRWACKVGRADWGERLCEYRDYRHKQFQIERVF